MSPAIANPQIFESRLRYTNIGVRSVDNFVLSNNVAGLFEILAICRIKDADGTNTGDTRQLPEFFTFLQNLFVLSGDVYPCFS